jgi:hypothetical protein
LNKSIIFFYKIYIKGVKVHLLLIKSFFLNDFTSRMSNIKKFLSAVSSGNEKLVKEMIDNGADVNEVVKLQDYPPLVIAAIKGNVGISRILLDHGADLNKGSLIQTGDGSFHIHRTALMAACEYGQLEMVRFLIEKGASVNYIMNYNQYTPLMFAVEQGHLEIAKLLVSAGAHTNVRDYYNRNLLDIAEEQKNKEMIHFIEHVDDVVKQNPLAAAGVPAAAGGAVPLPKLQSSVSVGNPLAAAGVAAAAGRAGAVGEWGASPLPKLQSGVSVVNPLADARAAGPTVKVANPFYRGAKQRKSRKGRKGRKGRKTKRN